MTARRSAPPSPPVRRCCRCPAAASWGYGVFLRQGKPGRWYCTKHKPAGGEGSARPKASRRDLTRQGELI